MTRGRGRGRGRGACGSSEELKRPLDAVEATDWFSKKRKVGLDPNEEISRHKQLLDMLPQDAQRQDVTTQKTYTLTKEGFDTRITIRLGSKSFT